jgi:polar amino acid transport system substrate-binding protein
VRLILYPRQGHIDLFFALVCCLYGSEAQAEPKNAPIPPIHVYTSEFPPYNFDDGSGKIIGLSTEVTQAVLKELNIKALPESMPWARTYAMAQKEPNILIHSITRTAEREKLFKWVGVIAPATYSLWALSSRPDIRPRNIEDLKKYRIGTTNNDVVEQYLLKQGLPYIDSVSGQEAYETNVLKLQANRIDLWGVSSLPGMYFLKRQGVQGKIVPVFKLKEINGDGMYLAFSALTDDVVVEQFRAALESIKRKGIYEKILAKYSFSSN